MQREPEVIRIPQKRYRELEEAAVTIRKQIDTGKGRIRDIFTEIDNYPAAGDLKSHHVQWNLREYLPYLVFYRTQDAFESMDSAFEETREYIDDLFSGYLDIIDNEEFEEMESIHPGEWKRMSLQERSCRFRNWISYYNTDEFETFMKDIGYLKFMGAYPGFTEAAFRMGKECPQLIRDLKTVWDTVQGEPIG